MKKFLLTIVALAALLVPAAADSFQNNIFLDLIGSRVYHHGTFLMMEELQELIQSQPEPVDNVIVTTDANSSAIMMLGIRDFVAAVSSAQVIFIFPKKIDYYGDIRSDTLNVFTLDRAPYFEPLSNQEYYAEQGLWEFNQPMPEETKGITVLMDRREDAFYMRGEKVHYSAPLTYLLEDFKMPPLEEDVIEKPEEKPEEDPEVKPEENPGQEGDKDAEENAEPQPNECEAPYLRVKITDNTTVADLLSYESTITYYAVNEGLQIQYAFFSPDTRVCFASAFNINPAYLDDLEIATVSYSKPEQYSVAPTYYNHTDFDDIVEQLCYSIPSSKGHDRGRVTVSFTVCIDGTIKDIVASQGHPMACERVITGLKKAAPFWSQALDNEGNPVNMRYTIKLRLQ